MTFHTILLDKKSFHELIPLCRKIYLSHHPELINIRISKSKILYEVMKYYIKTEKGYKDYFDNTQDEK